MGAAPKAPIPFPLPEDLTGRKVGRFEIHCKLGAGGMGEVWYAEDTQLQRPIALKRLTRKLGSDPGARRRILREAQRASALISEHIAAVHDILEENGESFLVMEYVGGETLRQHLQRPITLQQFFDIATQCAEALAAAHEHAIVHCDIKPENIMLTPEGRVKILDFGLAKHLPPSDQSSTLERTDLFGGTPAYMAPEILQEQLPDTRTDVFSLGVVFYEILTRRHPFSIKGFIATSERILKHTPTAIRTLNSSVPEALEAIVMKAMAKTPEQRYASARELLKDLRSAQAGVKPIDLQQTNVFQVEKRGWITAALLVLLFLAAVFGASWWMHRGQIIPERGWVLVSDFETSGDQVIPDKAMREGITVALQQSHYVNVFPRIRAYEVLERMKKGNVPRIDEDSGREICQRENLQVLLAGGIEHSGRTYQITVRGVEPVQGSLLFAEVERFDREDQFFEKADALAKKIREDLGESLERIERSSRPLARVTTASLPALQLYSRAKDAQYEGKDEHVESLLKGALQLDPNFAMAHLRLGQYYSAVVGKNERALAEVGRAYELRQGVTEREEHRIEAHFYDLQERYDEKAESLRVLVSLYPDDEEAHVELAAASYDLGQLDKSVVEAREALRLNPFSAPAYGGLVLYLARDNRGDEALAAAREAEERRVGSPRVRWGAGLAYLGQGNVSMARQEFQNIGRATETDRELQALCPVVVDLYEGKLASAQTELVKQIQAAPAQSGGLQLFRRYLLGRTYLGLGVAAAAELQADLILRTPPTRSQGGDLLNAGTLYTRVGRLAKAHAVLRRLDELQKRIPSSSNRDNFRNLEGEILLAESKPQEAEISFSISSQAFSPFISSMGLARTYQIQERWSLAAEEWEKVLSQKGEILQSGFPVDLASAHLELARVYRQIHNSKLARLHYEEALRMWQHADEFSLLQDARNEFRDLAPEASPPEQPKALPPRS